MALTSVASCSAHWAAAFADAVGRGASMKNGEIVGYIKQQIAALTS